MARHVVVFAIGPVQPFIAAARRTGDLWYGSTLLSRLAFAAAEAARKDFGAQLVFPAGAMPQAQRDLSAGVSNKVVCVLDAADLAALAMHVRSVVEDELSKAGEEALVQVAAKRCAVDAARFRIQLRQVLECFCAWAPWPANDDAGYLEAYRNANAMLEARKQLRNFSPNAVAGDDLPLSSLDAAAETVILSGADGSRLRNRFGINRTEELDAIGLVKRLLGRETGFPAVTRVALAPWVATWTDAECDALASLMAPLEAFELTSRNRCRPPDPSARFNWDAELLLPSRRREALARSADRARDLGFADDTAMLTAVRALDDHLTTEYKAGRMSLPNEDSLYVAMLLADGDRMGELLDNAQQTLPGHQTVSQQLAQFADDASGLVFKAGGACIYSGGDDLLALGPVDTVLACARDLADRFANGLTVARGVPATLSVGVGIAHVLTPFAELRALAERAKQLAKEGSGGIGLRNALALIVQPRNGAEVGVCGSWDEPVEHLPCDPGFDHRLAWWTDAFADGSLAGSAPYDLDTLCQTLPAAALPGEANRLFSRRTRGTRATAILSHLKQRLGPDRQPARPGEPEPHRQLALEWYVARWLAMHSGPSAATAPVAGASGTEMPTVTPAVFTEHDT